MKPVAINYIEFKATDLVQIKEFYSASFGWKFTDFGPTYTAFSEKESGIEGGFEITEEAIQQGALVILYHEDLEAIQEIIKRNGGNISVEIFSFPGGRRFHFIDPCGNELAVWSDQ